MTTRPEVWITGVGVVTSLGTTYRAFAEQLMAGRSGIAAVQTFDVKDHPSQIAGQVAAVPCPAGEEPAAFAGLHRLEQLARYCCVAALRDAGLWEKRQGLRVGLVLGVGAEWLLLWEADGLARGPSGWAPAAGATSLVGRTQTALRLRGPAVAGAGRREVICGERASANCIG